MRRSVLALSLLPLLLLAPSTAFAQDPPPHYLAHQTVVVRAILCDRVDQIESIVEAHITGGFAAGRRAYLALRATPNAIHEPSCLIAWYRLTVLEIATVFEDVPAADGSRITLYALHVLIGDAPYAILSPIPVGPPELDV